MWTMSIAAGFALLCAATSRVLAADMPVKATKEARAVAEPECLRWVQSNYNYCDLFPTIRARRDTVGSSEGRIQDRAPADTLAAGFARP